MLTTFARRLALPAGALILLALPAVAAAAPTAYVASYENPGKVYPLDTATNTVGTAIPVGSSPWSIAITPDGATAYVANSASNNVTPIDTSTNTPETPIAVGSGPQSIAITPDGTTAYVGNSGTNTVTPIDLTTDPPTPGMTPITVNGSPYAIAITPDGATAYAANQGASPTVTPIDTATNTADDPIVLPDGLSPSAMAMSPDGATAYVTSDSDLSGHSMVIPINTATNTAGSAITTGTGLSTEGIAITPDGTTALTADSSTDSSTPIDTSTNTAGATIAAGSDPEGIAVTPDGTTAYAADLGGGGVTPIDLTTDPPTPATLISFPVNSEPLGTAITPDQPPAAAFTGGAVPVGQQTGFDASGSSDPDSPIATYSWNFGDGDTTQTVSPTVNHTYAAAGNYQATVTVTDDAGCSTQQVFTGQTASCNGSSVAQVSHQVSVAKASPMLSTTASANIALGAKVHDSANLASGHSPTGQITFRLYGPGDATCSGAPAFTNAKAVSGNGGYQSAGFMPTSPGTYRWKASYSGDANNQTVAGTCGGPTETVAVTKATPTLTTTASPGVVLGGKVHDTARLAGGRTPAGKITFRLYGVGDTNCSGTPVFSTVKTVSGNGSYRSADFTPKAIGRYRWRATYSGDANNSPVAGACNAPNESVTVARG
jgi:YVTN family beta-propeller protein